MTVEERLAVVETENKTVIDILREIRTDVKGLAKARSAQDLRIASLEQTRKVTGLLTKILGVPLIGTMLHTVFKTIGLY